MWIRRAKFCPLCAAALRRETVEGRVRPRCPECGCILFENPAPAAAGIVVDEDHRILLVQRAIAPCRGDWALPAGYQDIDESAAQAAAREVREETGLEVEAYRLADLIFIPDDPRKPANLAVYLCRVIGGELRAGSDALQAEWFPLDELPENIAFDNRERILEPLARNPEHFGLS